MIFLKGKYWPSPPTYWDLTPLITTLEHLKIGCQAPEGAWTFERSENAEGKRVGRACSNGGCFKKESGGGKLFPEPAGVNIEARSGLRYRRILARTLPSPTFRR